MEPWYHASDFKRWAEALKEATTAQAAEQVLSQFNQRTRPLSERVGNGAFQLSEVNDTTVVLEKYEDYPFADRNNIQQVKLHFVGGDAATRLKWKDGVPDYGGIPPGNVDLPDRYREVHYVENEGMTAVYNLDDKHFGKRKFRQAINFMVDRQAANRNTDRAFAPEVQTGMPTVTARNWIPDYESFKENAIQYGPGAKPKRAEDLLTQIGYSRNGQGKWTDPDTGEVVSLKLRTPALWKDWWQDLVRTINAQFQQFGFETELEFMNQSSYLDSPDPADNDSVVHWTAHGPDEVVHPSPAFADEAVFPGHPLTKASMGGDPQEHFAGQPWEVEMPSELGVLESENTETFNAREVQKELEDPNLSDERARELTRKFAQFVNWNVAQPFISENDVAYAYDEKNFVYENFRPNAKYPPDKAYFAVPAGYLRSRNK
jgi:ABC-type transport system substrate-binding protein